MEINLKKFELRKIIHTRIRKKGKIKWIKF